MRKILLICSHYPPSNLTATHRVRLFAKHLLAYEWKPIVLTVDERHYEEKLDQDLQNLVPSDQYIERVKAYGITKPRIIGDLGLRAFYQLLKKAIHLIQKEKIDFVYIFIPSFYLALLGPFLFKRCGIKYGIDYIDPWVHVFPGSEKKLSRHWWSTFLSKILEPIAVKNASLITGVSEKYYMPVFKRNPSLNGKVVTEAIPYGWDKEDYVAGCKIRSNELVFNVNNKLKVVYPGAFLPASHNFVVHLFNVILKNREIFTDVEFYFLGTGRLNNDELTSPIKDLAQVYNIYNDIVFEYPNRLSYLNMLNHIANASGMFIIGSTESHYTPSKLFNAFIVQKPIFAVLNYESSGREIIETCKWGSVASFSSTLSDEQFENEILLQFKKWVNITKSNQWSFDQNVAEKYSVNQLTAKLNIALHNAMGSSLSQRQ